MNKIKMTVISSLGVFSGYIKNQDKYISIDVLKDVIDELTSSSQSLEYVSLDSPELDGGSILIPKNILLNSIIKYSITN